MSDKETDIEEKNLWQHVTRGIVPLNNKNEIAYNDGIEIFSNKDVGLTDNYRQNNRALHYTRSTEVDRNTERRLKRGQIPIDGRIDLHGMTQNQAYDALLSFIPHAYYSRKRCVLVITGKGDWRAGNPSMVHKKTGVLKQKTPIWLSSHPLNEYILKVKTARPNHGGEGALYILLRKNRK